MMSDDPQRDSHFRFDARPYSTRWSTDQQIAALQHGTDWLWRAIGKRLSGTRWERYRQILESNLIGPLDLGRRRQVSDAIRSGLELYLIARACEVQDIDPRVELLEAVVSGIPGEGKSAASAPWDAQHELFSLAMVSMSGIKDMWLAEPDIAIAMGPFTLGIPVKRVKNCSGNRLRSRLRECVKQTRANVDRGFAILDVADPALEFVSDAHAALEPSREYLARTLPGDDPDGWLLGFVLISLQFNWARTDAIDRVESLSFTILAHLANVQEQERTRVVDWLSARGRRLLNNFELELARLG